MSTHDLRPEEINQLASVIRRVDGDHALGAAGLAEALAAESRHRIDWYNLRTLVQRVTALAHLAFAEHYAILRAEAGVS